MRLIDADDLIERIKEQYRPQDNNTVADEIVGDIVHNLIEEAQTIDDVDNLRNKRNEVVIERNKLINEISEHKRKEERLLCIIENLSKR